jgi:hypothetical protein
LTGIREASSGSQPALELPHTLFKLPGSADGHDVFIGFDGDLTALGT